MLLRIVRFMVGEAKKSSIKLMALLAPAGAEVEAVVVAKADQHFYKLFCLWKIHPIFPNSPNPSNNLPIFVV